jgi:hypothetical protein
MKQNKSETIKNALAQAMASAGLSEDNAAAVEKVLETLDQQKLFRYHRDDEVSLLSTAGRVLVALIEDQTLTVRAMAIYLDLSETMIEKTVKQLSAAGMITKTKVNRQNVYRLNKDLIQKHSDIHHFLAAISGFLAEKSEPDVGEVPPF